MIYTAKLLYEGQNNMWLVPDSIALDSYVIQSKKFNLWTYISSILNMDLTYFQVKIV